MGFFLLEKHRASELSSELRYGDHPYLRSRRVIFGLCSAAAATLGVIALYQMGILKHLPKAPLPMMDAEKINSSPEAYSKLSTPDAALGVASYAVTMVLAAMGPSDRAQRYPLVPLAMAGKLGLDALNAGRLAVNERRKHRSLCSWCLVAVGATFAAAPFAIGEAREAWNELRANR